MANRRCPRSQLHAVMRWGLLALLVLFVYWDNTALRTDSLTYTSTALPAEFDGLRIVQLSDLHNREFGKNNQRLYAAVKQAVPDLIFLTGDLVDEYAEAPIPYAKAVGKALSAIAPTYYVTGNHEWAHGNAAVEELKTALRESGVTVLSNQFVPLERTQRLRRPDYSGGAGGEAVCPAGGPLLAAAGPPQHAFQRPVLPSGSGPDLLRPCPRRHLASALHRRAGRYQPEPAAVLHQRFLSLQRCGLRGGGGVCIPRVGQLSQVGLPSIQPAAGGGHHPEKRIEYNYDGNFFCGTI